MRERIEKANLRPQNRSEKGPAEVIPFPIDRQRGFVDNQLRSVRDYDDRAAYRWLKGVVGKHLSRLKMLGVSPDRIETEVAALSTASVSARPRRGRSRMTTRRHC
jgi:hypothetical protein